MRIGSGKEFVAIEEIGSTAGLLAIKDEWEALFNSIPDATPFQSPEWLIPWWRHLGDGKLSSLCLRTGGKLTCLAPLYIKDKEVLFLGTGISDYLDILFEPGSEPAGCEAIFRYICELQGWDRCAFHEIREASKMLELTLPDGFRTALKDGEPCLYLELPDTVEEFRNRGSKRRNGSRRMRTKLEKNGSLRLEAAGRVNLSEFLDIFFSLHEKRWKSQGMPGVLQGSEIRAFHEEAAAGLLETGMLRLYRLNLNEKPIAALYALVQGDRMYTYLNGYDPDFAELGPGKLVLSYAVEEAINSGLKVVDFLRGGEGYKYSWSPLVKTNKSLFIEHE